MWRNRLFGRFSWGWFGLGGILVAALAVRLQDIQAESAWWDEVVSLQHLDAPNIAAFVRQVRADDPPMVPLYFVIQYAWTRVFGTALVSVRLLSVLFGMASLVMVYLLGRKIFGACAGLMAAAMMAFSVPHAYYSQDVRPYALVLLLSATSAYAFLEALASGSTRWWAVNVLANLCLIWTHLFASLFLVVQGLFLAIVLWRDTGLRRVVLWASAHLPGVLAWALWFQTIDFAALDHASSLKRFITHTPGYLAWQCMWLFGEPVPRGNRAVAIPWWSPGMILALVAAIAVIAAIHGLRSRTLRVDGAFRKQVLFLLLWTLVPATILWAYSAVWYPSFCFRYVFHSLVPLLLLVGWSISKRHGRTVRAAAAAALLVLSGVNLARNPHPWRMDWKSVAGELGKGARARDPVLVYGETHRAPLLYATCFSPERVGIVGSPRGLAAKCAELADQGETVWVVVRTDGADASAWPPYEGLFAHYGLQYTKKSFGNIQPVLHVFRISSPRAAGGLVAARKQAAS